MCQHRKSIPFRTHGQHSSHVEERGLPSVEPQLFVDMVGRDLAYLDQLRGLRFGHLTRWLRKRSSSTSEETNRRIKYPVVHFRNLHVHASGQNHPPTMY